MWVIGDLKTGEIVQRYLCSDNEFSDSEYQKLYNISAKDVMTARFHGEDDVRKFLAEHPESYIEDEYRQEIAANVFLEEICKS